MNYRIRYAAAVVKELEKMSPDVARRIRLKINRLSDGLTGDVKRLTNFSPEYRAAGWRLAGPAQRGGRHDFHRAGESSFAGLLI